MYAMFLFGKNEVHFQVSFFRFIMLILAVYFSVFFIQIVPAYISKVYDTWIVVVIIITGLLPGFLIYSKYIFDAIVLSVIVTSIETMRDRRMVESVLRHQMEQKIDPEEVQKLLKKTEYSVQLEKLSSIFDTF